MTTSRDRPRALGRQGEATRARLLAAALDLERARTRTVVYETPVRSPSAPDP